MSDQPLTQVDSSHGTSRQSRRDRWATSLAALLTGSHFLALSFVFGWFYWIVPRLKYQIDQFGIQITNDPAIMVIRQSDFIVNYSYIFPAIGLSFLAIDFLTMRWMSKQIGLTKTCLFGVCVALIIFGHFAYGRHVLDNEIARLVDLS